MKQEKYIDEWLKTKNEIEILKNRQYGTVYRDLISKAVKNSKS